MFVEAVIVEQLDVNGELRTFQMRGDNDDQIIVALADDYDKPRSGPFHFLDTRHEDKFQRGFAKCEVRKASARRFNQIGDEVTFRTEWRSIPTVRSSLSCYAFYLPIFAKPVSVKFSDPRTQSEYEKNIILDDSRERYILYLECRSSHGSFDFDLEVKYTISENDFAETELSSGYLSSEGSLPEQVRKVSTSWEG